MKFVEKRQYKIKIRIFLAKKNKNLLKTPLKDL